VAPPGLSITTTDAAVRERTREVLRRLVDLCAELGGQYLVHGSPAQRRISEEPNPRAAALHAEAIWATVAEDARRAGVIYCIEPLASPEADFVNTLSDAAAIVQRIGNPSLRTMIDTSAAFRMEPQPLPGVIAQWLPTGMIAHVQLNDRNRRGPGQGSDRFVPILRALHEARYDRWIAIEPFDYVPDGPGCAARAIGYVAGILESIDVAS
jgi:D-psicose/D-tagatose/L-ribulose 3-epimerase